MAAADLYGELTDGCTKPLRVERLIAEAAANRQLMPVGSEPLDLFRECMSSYAREQADCHLSSALVDREQLRTLQHQRLRAAAITAAADVRSLERALGIAAINFYRAVLRRE